MFDTSLLLHYPCAAILTVSLIALLSKRQRSAALSILPLLGLAAASAASFSLLIILWQSWQVANDGFLLEKLALRRALRGSDSWHFYLETGRCVLALQLWIPSIRKKPRHCGAIAAISEILWLTLPYRFGS